jgi:FkbM family methyltransferase
MKRELQFDVPTSEAAVLRSHLAALIGCAGRIRPLERLAMRSLTVGRARGLLPKHVTGAINGRSIVLDLDEMVDAKAFVAGAYDRRGLGLMHRIMATIGCRTALDIGANIGNHSAFFRDWAAQVYAFEPNPPIFARLHSWIVANRMYNVVPIGCGLSNRNDLMTIYAHPGQAHLTTLEMREGAIEAGHVPVRVGDELLQERAIKDVNFIKLDVEGHEFEVLQGLRETVARERPVIVTEFEALSIRKFGSLAGLQSALPYYRFFGTSRRSLRSRFLKDGLTLTPFVFGASYSHIVCWPNNNCPIA